ncbi:MAG: MFS transporter [Clostridiales bacterium]|nr:MFS transporter [Clostridiales bacterium]
MKSLRRIIETLIYRNDPELLHNPYRTDQNWFIAHGVFNNAFPLLAYGIFLSGFAVFIGADDLMVGYLALIPSMSGVVSLFSSLLWRKVARRKGRIIVIHTVSRSIACLSVPITLLLPEGVRVVFFTAALIAANLLLATATPAINSWFVSVIPERIRGRYLAVRQIFMTVPAILIPLGFGRMLDILADKRAAFLIIYGAAFLLMLLTDWSYSRISEPPAQECMPTARMRDYIRIPLRNRRFIRFEVVSLLFNFAAHSSLAFTSAYLIRHLGISYQFITLSTTLLYITQIIVYRYVGRLSDRIGHRRIYLASLLAFALELAVWAMVAPQTYLLLLPLRSVISGCANAAYALSTFNYRYEIMLPSERDVSEGFHVSVTGIVLFIAPAAGRLAYGLIERTSLPDVMPFAQFRLLFIASSVMLAALAAAARFMLRGEPASPR